MTRYLIKLSMRLSDGNIKTKYLVTNINGEVKQIRRLCELGFIIGSEVVIVRKSIFKGVLLVKINNYLLAIKRKQLECVEVKCE